MRTTVLMICAVVAAFGVGCVGYAGSNDNDPNTNPGVLTYYIGLGATLDQRAGASVLGVSFEEITSASAVQIDGREDLAVFQNRLYAVAAGFNNNQSWSTADGLNWSLEGSSGFGGEGRLYSTALAFNGSLYVIGGRRSSGGSSSSPILSTQSVWISADGQSWTNAAPGCGTCPGEGRGFVYQGSMRFINTAGTTILSSSDGVNWMSNALSATIEPAAVFVFNGAVYVLDVRQSLWTSGDTINWTRLFFEVGPPAWHLSGTGAVFDNRLWLFATRGADASSIPTGAFYSEDGLRWSLVEGGCCGRLFDSDGGTSIVFRNRIWTNQVFPTGFSASFFRRPLYASLGGGTGVDGSGRTDFSL